MDFMVRRPSSEGGSETVTTREEFRRRPADPPALQPTDADRMADVFLTIFAIWVVLIILMFVRAGPA